MKRRNSRSAEISSLTLSSQNKTISIFRGQMESLVATSFSQRVSYYHSVSCATNSDGCHERLRDTFPSVFWIAAFWQLREALRVQYLTFEEQKRTFDDGMINLHVRDNSCVVYCDEKIYFHIPFSYFFLQNFAFVKFASFSVELRSLLCGSTPFNHCKNV